MRVAIEAGFSLISTYPLAGRRKGDGIRRLALPRDPYVNFYGVDEAASEVRIFTIRHAARKEER